MFIEDEDYVECIHTTLEEEGCNAEYAVLTAGEQFAAMFAAMDDAYMQARHHSDPGYWSGQAGGLLRYEERG